MAFVRFPAKSLLGVCLALILASCASVDVKQATVSGEQQTQTEPTEQAEEANPEALIAQGKLSDAAMLYLTIASRTPAPEKQNLQLKAIDLLIKEKHFDIADNLLAELNLNELNTPQTAFYAYLNAKIAINERNPAKSQQWLNYVKSTDHSDFASDADILKLYIATYDLAADTKNAALTRIKLEPYLTAENESLLNQQAIIRGLLSLDSTVLQNIAQTESDDRVRSWIDLSLLVKRSKNPFRLGNQLDVWKKQHPELPIKQAVLASLAPQIDDEPPKLENIALLLPLSGAYSKPASAIRDGFLASYYAQSYSDNAPTLRIYDTGATNSNILSIYQQAIDNGANIIVGPLRKKSVKEIAYNANHNIPILTLNRLDDPDFFSENLYQFSLSPEDEAKQTAQRAWLDGLNRAAVIFPENKWGKRVANAFREEWEKLGGKVVSETSYRAKKSDFSKPIKTLLAIDKSTQRRNSLARLLKTRLKFEPRRRQDIDFVFMAAFPKQARLIPPQLKFYHAANIPIYATSHSFSGRLNRKKDRDLDNVIIGDMPWTLTRAKNDKYRLQIYRTWPNKSRKFNRLYAFGTDAYNILYYLKWLRANSHSMLQGATGQLFMSENNRVMRKLSWAKFKRGKAIPLPATAVLDNP